MRRTYTNQKSADITRYTWIVFCLILGLSLGGSLQSLSAQTILRQPNIPDGETLSYQERTGNQSVTVTVQTQHATYEGIPVFITNTKAPDRETTVTIDTRRMLVVASSSRRISEQAETASTSRLVRTSVRATGSDILVGEFLGLDTVIRGLPFANFRQGKLRFASGEGFGIDLELRSGGTQRITVPLGSFDAYVLTLGASGILGGLVGRTTLWYSTDPPYRLLKSEGPSGGPGSPQRILELVQANP